MFSSTTPPASRTGRFKLYEPGYLHMDVKYLPQMQDEKARRYLFVAIDRATRWVFVVIKANMTAASAQALLRALHKARPSRFKSNSRITARNSLIACLPAERRCPAASMSLTGYAKSSA